MKAAAHDTTTNTHSIDARESPLATQLLSPDVAAGEEAKATYHVSVEEGCRGVSPVLLHALRVHALARTRVEMVRERERAVLPSITCMCLSIN